MHVSTKFSLLLLLACDATASSADTPLDSLEKLLSHHSGQQQQRRELSSAESRAAAFADSVEEDGHLIGSEVAEVSNELYDGVGATIRDSENGYHHVKSFGNYVDNLFKRKHHRRYIWSTSIIQDASEAPPASVNVNELRGSSTIIATPTFIQAPPQFTTPSVASAEIVRSATDSIGTDAIFLAESAFNRMKRYIWSNTIIQDGQDAPPAGVNVNNLPGSHITMTPHYGPQYNQPLAPSFPPLPAPTTTATTTTPSPSPSLNSSPTPDQESPPVSPSADSASPLSPSDIKITPSVSPSAISSAASIPMESSLATIGSLSPASATSSILEAPPALNTLSSVAAAIASVTSIDTSLSIPSPDASPTATVNLAADQVLAAATPLPSSYSPSESVTSVATPDAAINNVVRVDTPPSLSPDAVSMTSSTASFTATSLLSVVSLHRHHHHHPHHRFNRTAINGTSMMMKLRKVSARSSDKTIEDIIAELGEKVKLNA